MHNNNIKNNININNNTSKIQQKQDAYPEVAAAA